MQWQLRRLTLTLSILTGGLACTSGQAREPLFAKFGIGTFHPLQSAAAAGRGSATGGALPAGARGHLHGFFINCGGPLCFGNIKGLAPLLPAPGRPATA